MGDLGGRLVVMQLLLGQDRELADLTGVLRDHLVHDSSEGLYLGLGTMLIGEAVKYIHWVHHLVLEGSHHSGKTEVEVDLPGQAEAGAFDAVVDHAGLVEAEEAQDLDHPVHLQP